MKVQEFVSAELGKLFGYNKIKQSKLLSFVVHNI